MHPLLSLSVFGLLLLPVALMLVEDSPLDCVPRRSVPYQSNNTLLFREEGVFDYSTMLLREDLDLLVVGARGEVFALNLTDVTKKISSAKWEVSKKQVSECKRKGKKEETDCKNYIRVLHKREDGRMYVCGTNAFDPECDYMSFSDGKLTLEKKVEDGKGKCPFDPFQRHASIMIENDLYSATSMNFLGSEPVLMRSAPSSIRTEIKSSWLYDPNFVSMAWMPESEQSEDGDDDKVYLFFSETAVEYDCYRKLVVSRVARVCKGDLGGERTLQKRWTSFLKARLDCPIPGYRLPFIIQDSYRWCDSSRHWKDCIFYAVFTPQSEISDISAVCAYRVSDISKVFLEGKYKTPASVETSFIKWVIFSGEVPVPRPGACINNEARKMGINQTLQLPDRTLQFIRDKPLMDQAIEPIEGVPVLSRRGAKFTQIIVNQVQALDGEKYNVMFIGTDQGTLLKAFRYSDGEMFIIEEVQLFSSPQPVKILQFSYKTGQIYAGSDVGIVQISPANCERSSTCTDCILARDPYCGWDSDKGKCVSLSGSQRTLIQNMNGNSSDCKDEPAEPSLHSISLGEKVELNCPSLSNLAKLLWMKDDHELQYSPQYRPLILNGLANDAGLYRCFSVEKNKTGEHRTLVAFYKVSIDSKRSDKTGLTSVPQPQSSSGSHTGLICVIILLACCILLLLTWMSCKSRLRLLWDGIKGKKDEQQQTPDQEAKQPSEPLVAKTLNNHNSAGGDSAKTDAQTAHLSSMQFIDDESSV